MIQDKVFCCIPARIGSILISTILFVVYTAVAVALLIERVDLESWITSDSVTETALTPQAFDGVFYTFVSVFLVYAVVSLFGILSAILQKRAMVRTYHIINWFFVLLVLTATLAYWIYFKVKQDSYVNDCQGYVNAGSLTENGVYTPVKIPGKPIVAGGADKSYCIDMVNRIVIGSAIVVFVGNFIQVYFASSIGIYSTSLKRHLQHQQLRSQDDDDMEKI